MSQPVIADNQPKPVTLQKGKKYAFCACGHSQTQPFCDGSHQQFSQAQVGKAPPES